MNDDLVKKQRIRYFLMNMLAFALIFVSLGFVMFQLVNHFSYNETDQTIHELTTNKNALQTEVNRMLGLQEKTTSQSPPPTDQGTNIFNSQIIFWSQDGKILNTDATTGRLSQLENLSLNKSQLGEITSLEISASDTSYAFHSITKKYTNDDDSRIAYVQILANTNQVEQTVRTFAKGIIISMIIFWILSIAISYYLSFKIMQPLIKAWKKQQDFVENASHELRTPLTIIQNKLQSLFQHPEKTIMEEAESIALALNETRRLTTLTSDLLTIARSDSNQQPLQLEKVPLSTFLASLSQPFGEIAETSQKNFSLNNLVTDSIVMDRKKIHQVLVILLDNALKYTKAGDAISVTSKKIGNEWIVEVSNTGPSIDRENQKKIFDRFYREDQSRNKKTGGYGLGLAIAQQIIHQHKGKIKVLDNQPRGTIFQIKLPIKHKEHSPD